MSYDPSSPSDRLDHEPDVPAICEWCDATLDDADMNPDAFGRAGGFICQRCFQTWFQAESPSNA